MKRAEFEKIQQNNSRAKLLLIFNVKLETVIASDASDHGLGVVLLQKHLEEERPMALCVVLLKRDSRRESEGWTGACLFDIGK